MKKIFYIMLAACFTLLNSCEEDESIMDPGYNYEATVLGEGMDCGHIFLIELKNINRRGELKDAVYYAGGLTDEYKIPGLEMLLNCRLPGTEEIYPCTAMGPAYPFVIVENCIKREIR
jgi:hypothetical protein